MGRQILIAVTAAVVLLNGCGEDPDPGPAPVIRISISDHVDALTDTGYDNLCDITLTEAPGAYADIYLEVRVIRLDNGGPVRADFALEDPDPYGVVLAVGDTDADGLFDVGESRSVVEPVINFWDQTTVGRGMELRLDHNDGVATATLATGTWTPQN